MHKVVLAHLRKLIVDTPKTQVAVVFQGWLHDYTAAKTFMCDQVCLNRKIVASPDIFESQYVTKNDGLPRQPIDLNNLKQTLFGVYIIRSDIVEFHSGQTVLVVKQHYSVNYGI